MGQVLNLLGTQERLRKCGHLSPECWQVANLPHVSAVNVELKGIDVKRERFIRLPECAAGLENADLPDVSRQFFGPGSQK